MRIFDKCYENANKNKGKMTDRDTFEKEINFLKICTSAM